MESKRRTIRDGKGFDKHFPPPSEEDITVERHADVEDTMTLLQRSAPKTLWHTEKIAKKLKGRTLEETCSNIWHFVYDHIQYKRDKDGVEQVRSPRRVWWDREEGVDCDCYTSFISSILLNLKIPHKARITKYPKRPPEVPRWQHVYPIVPINGTIKSREDYIVMDCVKDEFDSEQPFLECKDYDMKLDYLDGFDQDDQMHIEPDTADLADLASIYEDEEMGNIFKKVGGALKKVGNAVKETVKKVGDKVGDGIRLINRFVNPATILLRNGLLLAMKVNMMNVAGRLRFAYLTDAQAQQLGVNIDSLKKLRAVKDRAETVYWQAGGKKENLKKAILNGKGNSDKKVPMNGLFGLDEVYMDIDEYNIIHSDPDSLEGLGEIVSGTAMAAASGAVAAIATALKQIKGLFNKGGQDEQSFQSDTDNAGNAAMLPQIIPDDEDALINQAQAILPSIQSIKTLATNEKARVAATANVNQSAKPAVPSQFSTHPTMLVPGEATQSLTTTVDENSQDQKGFVQKTTGWIKENPGKSLLIAGAVVGGSYLLVKTMSKKTKSQPLSGFTRKKKRKTKRKTKRNRQTQKLKVIRL